MIKLVTDTSVLKKVIPTTKFTKEEQDLATAALLTAAQYVAAIGATLGITAQATKTDGQPERN